MTKCSRVFWRAAALLIVATTGGLAQSSGSNPIEIGMDATFAHRSVNVGSGNSGSQTSLQVPAAQLRVGFFFTDMIALEPALGFAYRGVEGGHTTSTNLDVGVPINLDKDRAHANWYLRPFVGLLYNTAGSSSSSGPSGSASQINYGGGLGVRVPFDNRFSARFEANYRHGNEHDDFRAFDQYGLLAGLSFFTR